MAENASASGCGGLRNPALTWYSRRSRAATVPRVRSGLGGRAPRPPRGIRELPRAVCGWGDASRRAMVVPLAGRIIAAIVGVLLIYSAARSVIGTLIVPRPVSGWLTSWVDRIVTVSYRMATARMTDHHRRDRLLAGQAPAILLMQLVAWLVIFYIGFSLLEWPFAEAGITSAFSLAGPAVFGPNDALGGAQRTIADLAAIAGLITVTLQIAYLPTLYSEFNRRENEIALLNARG